jgi:hypothetical protein
MLPMPPRSTLPCERLHVLAKKREFLLHVLGLLAALAALGCAPRPAALPAPAGLAILDGGYRPLRERFDAERGRPRLLILASPT